MRKIIFVLLTTLICAGPALANSSVKGLFEEVESIQKGPFGLNYLQGTRSRGTVRDGGKFGGTLLFQAAFRNAKAQELAEAHGFYTGNLFTTTYYQLMGEFVYGDAGGSFELDHQGLLAKHKEAMVKASKIVPHWVLEKYYITKSPNSGLARGFATRGISGSEFESEYAAYFFNFYLSSLSDPYQYLPAVLLASQSPLVGSSALSEARDLITKTYDHFKQIYGANDQRVKGLYKIRNAIHNQVSERVLGMIENYLAENPWYAAKGNTYLQKIHALLTDYYNMSPKQIQKLAESVSMDKVVAAAKELSKGGINTEALVNLSEAVAYYRTEISSNDVISFEQKAQAMAVIVNTTQYLNKEVVEFGTLDSKEVAKILLNSIYAEGYLIEDNWLYFRDEISNSSSPRSIIPDVIDVATMTLEECMQEALGQWVGVTPSRSMENFIDDVIKGSALNSAAILANQ